MVVSDAVDKGHNVVFVDDINDSGLTMSQLQKYYDSNRGDNVNYVTLISKTTSEFTVDYTANVVDNDQWVQFFCFLLKMNHKKMWQKSQK